jgi:molybdenum cofactor biosynthesis enzyme MoaA
MNTEEDEFKRIEREAVMRKQDDDDIQDYVETAKDRMFAITFQQVVRNQTLEEVAKEFDKMRSLGDTAASFAAYVRNMKK